MRRQRHLGLLTQFIIENNIKKIAEVGVEKGGMTRYLLKTCPNIEEYWAIDQWKVISDLVHGFRAIQRNENDWFKLYQRVCKSMIGWKSLRVLHMISVEAAMVFPDEYFDFVYVDADHSYKGVLSDIAVWYPKVKKNKYLGGHDYNKKYVKKAIWHQFGNPFKDDCLGLLNRHVWLKQKKVGD